MKKQRWIRIAGVIAFLALLIAGISLFIDEPLRRTIERNMNESLKGYTARIGSLDFHPLGFSLDLKDVIITQNANPAPPVAHIPRLHASVHWREFLSAHLVADFELDRPKIYINLKNIRSEKKDKVPVEKRGWQDALQSIYPLKINVFTINDADFTYVDEGPFKPLHISSINLRAHNIRNIRSPGETYPSPVHLDGVVFDNGKLLLDGNANFLAEPHVAFKAALALDQMDLAYFEPIFNRYNLSVRSGVTSTTGEVEYAPLRKIYKLQNLTLWRADIDYIHSAATAPKEKQRVAKAKKGAEELSNKPTTLVKIDQLNIVNSSFGFVNKAANPKYRVFINDLELNLKNFSNHFSEGPALLQVKGKFMGSGRTRVTATFRPEMKGPDFDLNVAVEQTSMPAMNDLFRAYGNFDVTAGLFSFYSELTIRNNRIDGYVKPLFKNMKVYDRRQDKEKGLFRRLYEMLVGGVAKLLENPREQVATKADISGPVEDPETSTWQVILRLIQNAFFRAILPGFEQEVTQGE